MLSLPLHLGIGFLASHELSQHDILDGPSDRQSELFSIMLSASQAIAITFSGLWFLIWMRYMLPDRVTNAIYLRSFCNDRETGNVREAVQRALGCEFRLSGIRDPRRRFSFWRRAIATGVFAVQYCSPRYMNLEADEDDWKACLWRSFEYARCALIDVSVMTEFVKDEILLAHRCLGLSRILFIADGTNSVEEWRSCIADILGIGNDEAHDINIMQIRDFSRPAQQQLITDIDKFKLELPFGTAGLANDAFELVKDAKLPGAKEKSQDLAHWPPTIGAVLFSVICCIVFATTSTWSLPRLITSGLIWLFGAYYYLLLVRYSLTQYWRWQPSSWKRLVVVSFAVVTLVETLAGVLDVFAKIFVRDNPIYSVAVLFVLALFGGVLVVELVLSLLRRGRGV